MLPHRQTPVRRLGSSYLSDDAMLLASHFIRWYTVSICPNTGEVNSEHVIKVVSASFHTINSCFSICKE